MRPGDGPACRGGPGPAHHRRPAHRPIASGGVPYDGDILDEPPRPAPPRRVSADHGLRVIHRSGFAGRVVATTAEAVLLRDDAGNDRFFRWDQGAFSLDGERVTLVRPGERPAGGPRITPSGSIAVEHEPRVAQASRILVEGVHDADLLELVWGDDLRHEGIVVEVLDGVDHLLGVVARFEPGPDRRLGVLVDHLVPGSKEWRLAERVRSPYVLVTGTPYVDVWQAVRPAIAGIAAWPVVPPGIPWKEGVGRALGVDPNRFWPQLRNRVRSYADLEPALVGAVERLLDFLTDPPR